MTSKKLSKLLRSLADPDIAKHSQRFFKTGKGEYGEGDEFLGIRVPVLRSQAKKHKDLTLDDALHLLTSRYHEERLCALYLLVQQFADGDDDKKATVYRHYLAYTRYINNWDLVDSSAHQIVGAYLSEKKATPLLNLAKSRNLWERRIAIISTYHFIKNGRFDTTLELSQQLLNDREDLIHKAVGWMLREVGNRDAGIERAFLKKHYKSMPRTMLRYAIEKFPEGERKRYLRGTA
jgi:3-methyladenine DNA glycosylase AlkD